MCRIVLNTGTLFHSTSPNISERSCWATENTTIVIKIQIIVKGGDALISQLRIQNPDLTREARTYHRDVVRIAVVLGPHREFQTKVLSEIL